MSRRPDVFERAVIRDSARFLAHYAADTQIIIEVLLAAEDHRGRHHSGIDWLSFGRACLHLPWTRKLRGISTIEQQYARTVFRRRGSLLLCKLRELLLALQINRRVQKQQVWLGYLWRAYYGHHLNGYKQARVLFIRSDQALDIVTAARIVALLKYPRPGDAQGNWKDRHDRRTAYVLRRLRSLKEVRGARGAEAVVRPSSVADGM